MIYATPAEGHDHVAECHARLATVADLLQTAAEFTGLESELAEEYYREAATEARLLAHALRRAGGALQRARETALRDQGREVCLICGKWDLKDNLVREASREESKTPERVSHWWVCPECKEKTDGG